MMELGHRMSMKLQTTLKKMTAMLLLAAMTSVLPVPYISAQAQSAFDDPGVTKKGTTGGDLTAVSDAVDAGAVTLGASSQVVVLFRNDDTKPLKMGEISLYPSSNVSASVAQNQCNAEALAPQAVCAIAFVVKGLQIGKFRIEILARHDGRARLLTTSISGNVDSAGDEAGGRNNDLEILPAEVDFATLDASRSQIKSIMFRNITSQPIDIDSISVESGNKAEYSLDDANCKKLNSGGACVISLTWTPQQTGQSTASIVIRHSGPTGMASVPVKGIYTPASAEAAPLFAGAVPGKGLLVSSLNEINYGEGIEKASSITVSLVNAGDAPLTLNDMRLSNSENGIRIERTGCTAGRVLNPIEACPMTITWAPVRTGTILDDVTITHTGARGILVLPIRGSANQTVSKDSQAINLSDFSKIPRLSVEDVEGGIGASPGPGGSLQDFSVSDVRGVLDGYTISSLGARRAIINGPIGNRVVTDGEETVIGGIPWIIAVKQGAVQFDHKGQRIVLLFDRSLSFINSIPSRSGDTGSSPVAATPVSPPAAVSSPALSQ